MLDRSEKCPGATGPTSARTSGYRPGVTRAALPDQPAGTPWPTSEWPAGSPGSDVDTARLDALLDQAISQPDDLGLTLATVAIHRGRLVAERYGDTADESTTLISWSMAKSITHAVFGLLHADGLIDPADRAPVPSWANDERSEITVQHLLNMASGLHFVEDYVDAGTSDVIEMLFGAGIDDHAAYATNMPLDHRPGTVWNYSSGTTNILARIAGDLIGGGRAGVERYLGERLFGPLGMTSADPRFDTAGTFVGSSYVYASARDFARFGLLHLRDGIWDGARILPEGWVDHARTPVSIPISADLEPHGYGAHWWLWRHGRSAFHASGYEGQRIIVSPEQDLVLVRLGKSPAELQPAYDAWLDELLGCFPVI